MRELVRTLVIVLVAGGSLPVRAQERYPPASTSRATPAANPTGVDAGPLSAAAIEEHFSRWARDERVWPPEPRSMRQNRRMGAGRRALIIAASAAGGFFAGGFLGHTIENTFAPCGCDDPGLKGALIGAPVGAITGGVIAAILTR